MQTQAATLRSGFLLRRRDQATLAILTFAALAAIGWWYVLPWANPANPLVEAAQRPSVHARFQLDINTALWPELVQLPDIAKTRADEITGERKLGGPYRSVEDLERAYGIGEKRAAKIAPFLLPLDSAE